MTFSKCKFSEYSDQSCPFARDIKRGNKLVVSCDLIYPIWAEDGNVENLDKCFNRMKSRDKLSFSRKVKKHGV